MSGSASGSGDSASGQMDGSGTKSYHNGGVEGSGLSDWYDANLADKYAEGGSGSGSGGSGSGGSGSGSGGSGGSGSGGSGGSGSGGSKGSGSGGSKGSGSGGSKGSGSGGSKGSGSGGSKGSGSGGSKGSGSGGSKRSGSGGSKGSGSGGSKGSGSGGSKGSGSGGSKGSGSGGSKGSGSGGSKGSGSGGSKGSGSGGTKGSPPGGTGGGGTTGVTCFCKGTRIRTWEGVKNIEELQPGDRIQTYDGSYQVLRTTLHTVVPGDRLAAADNLRPVRISSGALGGGLPVRDLFVSRQHRMLVSSPVARRMFGEREVLVSAAKLTALPGVYVDEDAASAEYFHLVFDTHEIVWAEGAPSESFFAGANALAALDDAARAEMQALFPQQFTGAKSEPLARFTPDDKRQKKLVARHALNQKPMFALE